MGFEPGLARDCQCCCVHLEHSAWPHPDICVLVLSRPQRDASVEVSTGHLLCLPCHPPPPALASLQVGDPPPPAPGAVPRVAFPRPSAKSHSSGSCQGSPGVVVPGSGSDAHLVLSPVTPAHTAAPLQVSSTLKGAAVPSRLFFSLPKYLKFTHFPREGPFSCKPQILPLSASPFLSNLLSYPEPFLHLQRFHHCPQTHHACSCHSLCPAISSVGRFSPDSARLTPSIPQCPLKCHSSPQLLSLTTHLKSFSLLLCLFPSEL